MKTEIFENESTVVIATRLRVCEIEPNLNAYRTVTAVKPIDSTGKLGVDIQSKVNGAPQQGFVDDKNLQRLKAGQKHEDLQLSIITAEGRELLRTKGWNEFWENDHKHHIGTDVFAAAENPDDIVRLDHSSWMMFDRHGEALPVALDFDYISHGGITDGRYDLKKLATHLLGRNDVWIFPRATGWRGSLYDNSGRATTLDECIVDIPSYNRERGCERTIYFRWQPDVASYRRMWAECLAKKKKYPSTHKHEAIWDLDLLGVRAAGCTYFDDYHKSKRYDNCGND